MHENNYFHRDLKPANILVDLLPGGVSILKIGDFGVSKVDLQSIKRTATMSGSTTPEYIAPEIVSGKEDTPKIDIWAAGIILY